MPEYNGVGHEEDLPPPLQYAAGLSNFEVLNQPAREAVKIRIKKVETAIQALHEEQTQIQKKLDEANSELKNLKIAIAPHKHFPVEILTRIFFLTLEDDRGICQLHIPIPPRYAPWSLRQVCSSWRQLILNYPPMWSNIRLCTGSNKVRWNAFSLERRINFVKRRILPDEGPITLSLYPFNMKSEDYGDYIGDAILLLVWRNLRRIQDLDLLGHPYGMTELFETTNPNFHNLKRLKIACYCRGGYGRVQRDERAVENLRRCHFFKDCSSLQELRLSGDEPFWNEFEQLIPRVPWGQLLHLTLNTNTKDYRTRLRYNWIAPVLRQSTNLTSLELTFTQPKSTAEESDTTLHFTLPKLQTLIITITDPHPITMFTLPALEVLELISDCPIPVVELIKLVKRSTCSLKGCTMKETFTPSKFKSSNENRANYSLYEFYDLLPDLERLDTIEVGTTGILEDAMLLNIGQGELLPSLVDLSCRTYESPSFCLTHLGSRFGRPRDSCLLSCKGFKRVRVAFPAAYRIPDEESDEDSDEEDSDEEDSDEEEDDEDDNYWDEEGSQSEVSEDLENVVPPISPESAQAYLRDYGTFVDLIWEDQLPI